METTSVSRIWWRVGRGLFASLVLRDALTSSGCLGYSSSCRWSACCCYANENISKLPEKAVVCQARVLYLFAEQCYRVMNRPWKYDAISNLWEDAFSNFISHSWYCPFSTFSLHRLPITCLYFIIYIPPHVCFGAVYQFNQFAHREKEEGLVGREEGRREAAQSASSPHPHSNASLLGSHHQPRRQVSAITVN